MQFCFLQVNIWYEIKFLLLSTTFYFKKCDQLSSLEKKKKIFIRSIFLPQYLLRQMKKFLLAIFFHQIFQQKYFFNVQKNTQHIFLFKVSCIVHTHMRLLQIKAQSTNSVAYWMRPLKTIGGYFSHVVCCASLQFWELGCEEIKINN